MLTVFAVNEIFLIRLLPESVIYKSLFVSIVIPVGLLNLDNKSGPFVEPVISGLVVPARVLTLKVFAAINRIELLPVSVT